MKLNILLLFTAAVLIHQVFISPLSASSEAHVTKVGVLPTVTPTPTLIPTPTKVVSIPAQIQIPKLGINTVVEQVGQDSEGRMFVPQNPANVGWYNLGYKPGQKGSAVIAGHLDTLNSQPAIFYYLSQLQPGDEVYITDTAGERYKFVVKEAVSYPYDQVPLPHIFENSDSHSLNLITCDGHFDYSAQTYSHRIVVYTELVQ